jgi:hypothetical protein
MKERLIEYDPSSLSQRVKAEVQKVQPGSSEQCCSQHAAPLTAARAQVAPVQNDHAEFDERMLRGALIVLSLTNSSHSLRQLKLNS